MVSYNRVVVVVVPKRKIRDKDERSMTKDEHENFSQSIVLYVLPASMRGSQSTHSVSCGEDRGGSKSAGETQPVPGPIKAFITSHQLSQSVTHLFILSSSLAMSCR